jgi:hypothetical protein
MTLKKQMRTLIYKRTHCGDPDPKTGVFGNNNCMKQVRGWSFDAVIGVGGIGREPQKNCIAKKLTWVGIGPQKTSGQRYLLVTFDHFLYYGDQGPLLEDLAPKLAKHIYSGNVRVILNPNSLSADEHIEVEQILNLARNKPSSRQLAGASQRTSPKTHCKRLSKSSDEGQ